MGPRVLGGLTLTTAVSPERLMIPAAIPASCVFMLPVATPPSAIVFGSQYLTLPLMARVERVMKLIGVVWTIMLVYLLALREDPEGSSPTGSGGFHAGQSYWRTRISI